jgi:two-component system sensor histidine kinase TctE
MPSIRRRLLVSLLLPSSALLIVVAAGYLSAVDTVRSVFDRGLADDATALASRALIRPDGSLTLDLPPAAEAVLRMDSEDQEFFSAWGPDGELLAGDADLLPSTAPPTARLGVGDGDVRGLPVRRAEFRLETEAGPVTVVFAETLKKRTRAEAKIFFSLVIPNFAFIFAALGLSCFGVVRALEPLSRLSRLIVARSADDSSPLDAEVVVGEVRPLVDAMNGLISKLAAAGQAQRRFLADAAHQLRTPLAGLQTQIELLAADLPEAERKRATTLAMATQRVGRLLQQLLALARAAPEATNGHTLEDVDIAALVEVHATDWHDAALLRGADLGFELAPASVRGICWLLGEMLSNLVDNAVRHGGRRITVRCGTDGGAAYLEVEDDGKGIPESERARVFERFYRGSETAAVGTGLGLAIVREIAEAHAAGVDVSPGLAGCGVRFRITFPKDGSAGRTQG